MLRTLLKRAFSTTTTVMKSKKFDSLKADEIWELFSKKQDFQMPSAAFHLRAYRVDDGQPLDTLKVSIIAAKKTISKSAVIRNRATRRVKSAVRQVFCDYAPKSE